jgi:hypothetical protein
MLAPTPMPRRPTIRTAALVALAALVVFVVWLLSRGDDSSITPEPRANSVFVSLSGLKTLAEAVPSPIYWVGPQAGHRYELSKTDNDRVWIRYLPEGVAVGSDTPYLTVGTYPMQNAFAVTSQLARQSGSVKIPIADGGVALYDTTSPTSVYLAYPGVDEQVEVYDPSAGRAQGIVASGQVRPVSPKGGSHAVSGAVRPGS